MSATLIGVDEAGYGPNLGPLVIAATRWRVPSEAFVEAEALDELLTPFVQRNPVGEDPQAIGIADSKKLYSPGGGLQELERGVLSCLGLANGAPPADWCALWRIAAPDCQDLRACPWRADFDAALPIDAAADSLAEIQNNLRDNLTSVGVELEAMRAAVVFPARFNELVERHGNKATLLSETSLDLVEQLLPPDDQPTLVHCDKHGGRKRYGPLLQARFADDLVRVRKETQLESEYGLGGSRSKTRWRFVAKGDHFLPAALASMLAKYLREQAMAAFNHYWSEQVPGIRPTAGYPVDAKRFKNEISDAQTRLKISDHDLWRNR